LIIKIKNRQSILGAKNPTISDVVQRLKRSDTISKAVDTAATDELVQKYLLRLRQKLKAPLQPES